jgi:hypothetical protein
MQRAYFPIIYSASPAVVRRTGPELHRAVILALRALLLHGRSLEVAHQQIQFQGHHLAFCSRISSWGDLIIDLDVGDERLSDRIILEDELRTAERKARRISGHR